MEQTWATYRAVWGEYPLLLVYAVVVVAVLILSIIGTIAGTGILALLFIPALAGAYVHHLMVMKRAPH